MRQTNDGALTAVLLTSVFLSPQTCQVVAGGSARVVLDLARLLRDVGFNVHVVQKGPRNETIAFESNIRVEMVRAQVRTSSDFFFACRTRRIAQEAALCCYATPELGFPFYARHGIAIQHGIWWDGPQFRGMYGSIVRGVQWLRNLCMCKRLRAVLCVDTNFINYLRSGGAPLAAVGKCRYVPNYVDLDQAPVVRRTQLLRRHRARRLLFLRRYEEDRGPDLFVEVCDRLRSRHVDFSARMVGWGSLKERTRQRIVQKRLDNLIETDERSLDDVLALIDECAISIVPSLWSEGTSLAAIESIALGVPVVSTDVGGLGNVVIPHFNGFISHADAGSIADHVERLLQDEDLYMRISGQCLAMREAFSRERWRSNIVRLLTEIGLLPLEAPPGTQAELVSALKASRQTSS